MTAGAGREECGSALRVRNCSEPVRCYLIADVCERYRSEGARTEGGGGGGGRVTSRNRWHVRVCVTDGEGAGSRDLPLYTHAVQPHTAPGTRRAGG